MTKHPVRHLTEHAVKCLSCACANLENFSARELLQLTDCLSSSGVLAAVFIADSHEHEDIVRLAREAIHEQRDWCRTHGPVRPTLCTTHKLASR